MHVLAKLALGDKKSDLNALIYNLKSEFCNFYATENFDTELTAQETDKTFLAKVEMNNTDTFFATKDSIPFKVTIDWKKETIAVKSVGPAKEDITFYIYRTLELCNNFAIYELTTHA